jgi:hypothetical protein
MQLMDAQLRNTALDDAPLTPLDAAFIIQKCIFFTSRLTHEENGSVSGGRYMP